MFYDKERTRLAIDLQRVFISYRFYFFFSVGTLISHRVD